MVDDKAYIGLGQYLNDFWSYAPATGTWQRLTDLPAELTIPVGLSANGKGYIAGSAPTEGFWEYDPATGEWLTPPYTPWSEGF